MNARISTAAGPIEARTTTVFTSGNSQAVRLPKEFRLRTQQVTIERRGDEIVLRERRQTVADVLAGLPPLTLTEAGKLDQCLQAARDMRLPEERDWLGGPPAKRSKASR